MRAELMEKDGSVQQLTSEVEVLKSRLAHAEAELRDAIAAREAVPDEDERVRTGHPLKNTFPLVQIANRSLVE